MGQFTGKVVFITDIARGQGRTISSLAPTLAMEEDVWDETIEVNLSGQWKTIRAAVPHVRASGDGGSVVIISSLAAM